MEKADPILSKIKQAVPGAVLESGKFGRSKSTAVWIESRSLGAVAAFLSRDTSIVLDWLENFSVIQSEETLIATYFLSSRSQGHSLILRASVVPPSTSKEAILPSVSHVWSMAVPFEVEAGELYGIRFTRDGSDERAHAPHQLLPKDWNGFPLRKSYVFPTGFVGISHSRRGARENQ